MTLEDEAVDHVRDDDSDQQHASHQHDVAVADVSLQRDRPDDAQAETDEQQALAKITIDDESQDHTDRQHCIARRLVLQPEEQKARERHAEGWHESPGELRRRLDCGVHRCRRHPTSMPLAPSASESPAVSLSRSFSRCRDPRWQSSCSPRSASTPLSGADRCSPRRSSKARRTIASVQTAGRRTGTHPPGRRARG